MTGGLCKAAQVMGCCMDPTGAAVGQRKLSVAPISDRDDSGLLDSRQSQTPPAERVNGQPFLVSLVEPVAYLKSELGSAWAPNRMSPVSMQSG
jgi:hypothetical protein